MSVGVSLLVVFVCLALEAFFSGSEIAIVSADRIKLRHAAAKGSRGAALALRMLTRPEWLLATTLVGTNIAVVTNTTVVTALMIELLDGYGELAAVLIAAPLIWVFGEIVPKSVFQQRADRITPRVVFPLRIASFLFSPVLIVFTFLSGLLTRLVGSPRQNPFTLREEIITMLQMPVLEGDIQPVEITMIRRMFNFSETTAREIMVPIVDVVTIEHDASCGDASRQGSETAHIRLPVRTEDGTGIVGVLNTLELLGLPKDEPIEPHVRPVHYAAADTSIRDLMMSLRKDGDVVAVILDEESEALGIVTIEDIMEEVVEEMEDEYDIPQPPTHWVRRLGERDYVASAQVDVDHLCERLDIELPRGKYTTLAGLLLQRIGEIPPKGTSVEVGDVTLTVHRSAGGDIEEVRVRW